MGVQEARIEDYLTAYRTTGQPPAPVPQEPTNDQQRTLLNLPPLFKPYSARDTGPASFGPGSLFSFSNSQASGITAPPVQPAAIRLEDLPAGQEFLTTTSEGEVFQSISVMPTFRGFSPEVSRGTIVAPLYIFRLLCALFVSHPRLINCIWLECNHRNFAVMLTSRVTNFLHRPSKWFHLPTHPATQIPCPPR